MAYLMTDIWIIMKSDGFIFVDFGHYKKRLKRMYIILNFVNFHTFALSQIDKEVNEEVT